MVHGNVNARIGQRVWGIKRATALAVWLSNSVGCCTGGLCALSVLSVWVVEAAAAGQAAATSHAKPWRGVGAMGLRGRAPLAVQAGGTAALAWERRPC